MEMNDLLHAAVDSEASDLLLANGAPPMLRIRGKLRRTELESLTPRGLEQLCQQVLTAEHWKQLEQHQDVDFSIAVPRLGRFRFNVHRQRGSLAAAIRHIPNSVPDIAQLNLPPATEELTKLSQGLVLVTGQTGSGKTTTLGAMIERINQRDAKHIITLEDPIEFQFAHGRSLVEQREIGTDCPSFASGLRHVLRQDPDVILVGEIRDLETIRTALQAAETGHLVLATLHSSTAASTVDRIIEVFPPEEQSQTRVHLAESLKAVITQRLVKSLDGRRRVAACEVMLVSTPIQTSIREGTTHLIPSMISTSSKRGMQTMEQALKQLVLNGQIDQATADSELNEISLGGAIA
jgi:twitching motility protein PilT